MYVYIYIYTYNMTDLCFVVNTPRRINIQKTTHLEIITEAGGTHDHPYG